MKDFHLETSPIRLKMKMPLPWHLLVYVRERYRLHDPEGPIIILGFLELLEEDDVLTGEQEGGREEVVLVGLLLIVLLVEPSLVLLEVLIEHVLPAELVPTAEVVDPHMGQHAMLLEHPVDLFLLAPHDCPVVVPGLPPLPARHPLQHRILEGSLETDVGSTLTNTHGGTG